MTQPPPYPGMPRWVKIQWPFVALLLALVIGMSTGFLHHSGHAAKTADSPASEGAHP